MYIYMLSWANNETGWRTFLVFIPFASLFFFLPFLSVLHKERLGYLSILRKERNVLYVDNRRAQIDKTGFQGGGGGAAKGRRESRVVFVGAAAFFLNSIFYYNFDFGPRFERGPQKVNEIF